MSNISSRSRATGGARVLARLAWIAALGSFVAPAAQAQFDEQQIPPGGITVDLDIDSRDEFLRSTTPSVRYAPMLDMRRRILANTYAWGAELAGPSDSTLSLSEDACREDGAGPVAGTARRFPQKMSTGSRSAGPTT